MWESGTSTIGPKMLTCWLIMLKNLQRSTSEEGEVRRRDRAPSHPSSERHLLPLQAMDNLGVFLAYDWCKSHINLGVQWME